MNNNNNKNEDDDDFKVKVRVGYKTRGAPWRTNSPPPPRANLSTLFPPLFGKNDPLKRKKKRCAKTITNDMIRARANINTQTRARNNREKPKKKKPTAR